MLPQGRFQAFLRAVSEDRHRCSQQLFRTERFEQVEALAARPSARPAPAQPGARARRRRSGAPHQRDGRGIRTGPTTSPPPRWSAGLVASGPRPVASPWTERPPPACGRGRGARRPRGRARGWPPCATGTPPPAASTPPCSPGPRSRGRTRRRRRGRTGPGRRAGAPGRRRGPATRTTRPRSRVDLDRSAAAALLDAPPDELTTDAVPHCAAEAIDAAAAARGPAAARARARRVWRPGWPPRGRSVASEDLGGLRQRSPSRRERQPVRLTAVQAARDDAVRRVEAAAPSTRSATTWSPRSSTSTVSSRPGWCWWRSSSRCSRPGSTGWPPRSPAGSPSGAAAARSAGPSTTRTSRPRPRTRRTPPPRRRCASGSTTPRSRSMPGPATPRTSRRRRRWPSRPPGPTTSTSSSRPSPTPRRHWRPSRPKPPTRSALQRVERQRSAGLDTSIAAMAERLVALAGELDDALGEGHDDVPPSSRITSAQSRALTSSPRGLLEARRGRSGASRRRARPGRDRRRGRLPRRARGAWPPPSRPTRSTALQATVDEHARGLAAAAPSSTTPEPRRPPGPSRPTSRPSRRATGPRPTSSASDARGRAPGAPRGARLAELDGPADATPSPPGQPVRDRARPGGRAGGVRRGQVRRQPAADAAVGLRPGLPALPGRRGGQRAAGRG